MEGRLLLDVIVGERPPILELLASKDQTLLIRWDSLLVLDLCLDIVNCVRGLNLEGDGLASEGLHKDLHLQSQKSHVSYLKEIGTEKPSASMRVIQISTMKQR